MHVTIAFKSVAQYSKSHKILNYCNKEKKKTDKSQILNGKLENNIENRWYLITHFS